MTSKRAHLVRAVTGVYFKTVRINRFNVKSMRRRMNAIGRLLAPAPGVEIRGAAINGLQVEYLTPQAASDGKLLIYLHGGAYIAGSSTSHRQRGSHVARAANVRTIVPNYRLAPEHPFPCAVDDAAGVYRKLLSDGHAAKNLVFVGDSAGGGLAMATLLTLRDAGDPLPAAACLLSPWLDLAGTGESMRTHAHRDPWFRTEDLPLVARYYCTEGQFKHPLVSPVYANLGRMPPLFIQVGAEEILLSDSTRIADMVQRAGGCVDLEIWPDMWHVFQAFVNRVPESRTAVDKIGAFIRHRLEPIS
jgi:acetyl esterase/lipase